MTYIEYRRREFRRRELLNARDFCMEWARRHRFSPFCVAMYVRDARQYHRAAMALTE